MSVVVQGVYAGIRCSGNTLFLISLWVQVCSDFLTGAVDLNHLFLCVHFKTSPFASKWREEGTRKTSDFHFSSLHPAYCQLTWLSKFGRSMERISAFLLQELAGKWSCWILTYVLLFWLTLPDPPHKQQARENRGTWSVQINVAVDNITTNRGELTLG